MNSIIITYRNRESHLKKVLPRLLDVFKDTEHEIIISEQNDDKKFYKSGLYNLAFKKAKGDTLILHDVDHFPTDDVDYTLGTFDASYPARRIFYVDDQFNVKSDDQVPPGYRSHKVSTGLHSGGVVIISRKAFEKVNGFNPLMVGWGKEDDDFRERLTIHKCSVKRGEVGTFCALPHSDNHPGDQDLDFINNSRIYSNIYTYIDKGYKNVEADEEKFATDNPNLFWYKFTNFKTP